MRSNPKEELRLAAMSRCPDRFSRREACKPKPESFRETGVLGKDEERGDTVGDGGEAVEEELLARLVELVEGLSLSLLEFLRMPKKAL